MALWGKNDNVLSTGTVALNYSTGVVTGTGTSFGITGGCSEGQVIRFGTRTDGGSTDYFGDAVIVSIANSESLTIGSTAGLSGDTISGAQFQISELPKSSILDVSYSDSEALSQEGGSIKPFTTVPNLSVAGVGVSILSFDSVLATANKGVKVGDFVVNNGVNHEIIGLGTATLEVGGIVPVGFTTIFFDTSLVPGLQAGTLISSGTAGTSFTTDGLGVKVVSTAATFVTVDAAVTATIGFGTVLLFSEPGAKMVSLASTIGEALLVGADISIARHKAGYDKYLYGVSGAGVTASAGSKFEVDHAGWVGVTTYIDTHGNLRVKKEVLVAMGSNYQDGTAGIQTGNVPVYDSNPAV